MLEAATQSVGHTFTLAGDFACGLRCVRGGGPPTTNVVEPGDLYILDLFPACAFYFGDTCPHTSPSARLRASNTTHGNTSRRRFRWRRRCSDQDCLAESCTQPFTRCLATHEFGSSFWHHAGHGVGYPRP